MSSSLTDDHKRIVKSIIENLGDKLSPGLLVFLVKKHLGLSISVDEASDFMRSLGSKRIGSLVPIAKEPKSRDLKQICLGIINESKVLLDSEGGPLLISPDSNDRSTLTPILFLSDLHIGEVIEVNGREIFNIAIAEKRLASIVDQFIVSGELRGYSVSECVVILGGDIIDGELIYPAQSFNTESHGFDQVRVAVSMIWKQLMRLQELFGVVRVYCVPGNHGRSSKLHHQMTNWDNVLYFGLQLMAKLSSVRRDLFESGEGIEVSTPLQMWMDFKVREWNVHIRHIGVTQPVSAGPAKRMMTWLDNHNADLLFYGHYHSPEMYSIGHRRVFKNGALPPGNDYSEMLGYVDSPGQWMIGVTDRNSVEFAKILVPNVV